MAFPREPDQTYRPDANDMPPRPSRFDDDLQPDLELTEGPAGAGRMVAYAVAALLIIGAVLYGVTHTSTTDTASTGASPATNTAANAPAPAPPPPVRNVTPGPNTQPGTTTGAAPSAPAPQSTPAPQGAPNQGATK